MKDNSKLLAIILVIVTIVVVVLSSIFNGKDSDDSSNSIYIVQNYSDFYTVNSCLYRTITYISTNDSESLMLLINENYKDKNNINKSNVINLFPKVDLNSTFVSEKMYYEQQNANLTKYYVKGRIEPNQIYDDSAPIDYNYDLVYFIVYLDSSNNLFSIEPYDGKLFKEGELNEK